MQVSLFNILNMLTTGCFYKFLRHDHTIYGVSISLRLNKPMIYWGLFVLYRGAVSQTSLQTDFIPHHRNMCPDLSTKTFHLFSNTLPLVTDLVLIVIEKVKARTHVWCLPTELAVSPLISPESDLTSLFDCTMYSVPMHSDRAVYMNMKVWGQ